MTDKKISELSAATTLDGTELVPIVQAGETVRTTIADFTGQQIIDANLTYYVRTDPVAVTFTTGTPGVVNWTAHGLAAGAAVVFSGPYLGGGNTLPAEITEGQIYYVKTATGAGTFTIAATVGGTAINFTTAGGGTRYGQTGSDNNDGLSTATPFLTYQHAINTICAKNWIENGGVWVLAIRGTGVFIEAITLSNHKASHVYFYPAVGFPLPNKVVFRPTAAQVALTFGSIVLANGYEAIYSFHDGHEFDGINAGSGVAALCALGGSSVSFSGQYIKNCLGGWCLYIVGAKVGFMYTLNVGDCTGSVFAYIASDGHFTANTGTIIWDVDPGFTTIFQVYNNSTCDFISHYSPTYAVQFSGTATGTAYTLINNSRFSTEEAPPGSGGTHDNDSVVIKNKVYIAGAGGRYTDLLFPGTSSGTVTVKPAAAAGTWTFTLPTTGGTNGYVLQTDGAGVSSWVSIASTPAGAGGANTQIQYNSTGALAGSAAMVFDGTTATFAGGFPPIAAKGSSGSCCYRFIDSGNGNYTWDFASTGGGNLELIDRTGGNKELFFFRNDGSFDAKNTSGAVIFGWSSAGTLNVLSKLTVNANAGSFNVLFQALNSASSTANASFLWELGTATYQFYASLVGTAGQVANDSAAGDLAFRPTGAARNIIFTDHSANTLFMIHKEGAARVKSVAFASLPASPVVGMIQAISNSTTATWGATIAGGGANAVLGWYNGTNWTVIGA